MHKWLIGLVAVTFTTSIGGVAQADPVPQQRCTLFGGIDRVTAVATITVERDDHSGTTTCPPDGTNITYAGDQHKVTFLGEVGTTSFVLKEGVYEALYGESPVRLSFSRHRASLNGEPQLFPKRQIVQWWLELPSNYDDLQATMRATAVDASGLVTTIGPKVLQGYGVSLNAKYSKPGPVTMTLMVEDALGVVSTQTQQTVVPGPPGSPRTKGKVENSYRVRCGASVSDTGEPRQPRKPGYDRSYLSLRWTSDAGKQAKSRIQVKGSQLSGTYKAGRLKTTFFKSFRGPAKGTYKARVQVSNQWGTSPWSKWKKLPVKTSKTCA